MKYFFGSDMLKSEFLNVTTVLTVVSILNIVRRDSSRALIMGQAGKNCR